MIEFEATFECATRAEAVWALQEIIDQIEGDYHEALSVFRRYDGSATLYGINEMGDYSVIFSK